nr:putative late blight resistance protein homolog R1B-14 [Ipomoea batatas]
MAIGLDTVVEDVASKAVNELVQFVAKNVNLVVGIDSEIIDLTSDIETFNARLVDASKTPKAKELQVMKVIVKKFRAVVDEAKDAIDKYLAEKKNHGDKTFTKCFHKLPHYGKVNAFATEIQSIRTKVNAILQNHERDLLFVMQYPNSEQNNDQSFQTRPVVEREEVVGFDDDLKTIKALIIEEPDKFRVIPIVGMAGTGKTTFVAKLFGDPDILNKFALCIWVHVSQGFDRKQKLIDIIHQIKEGTDDYSKTSGDRLRDEINKLLTDQKYFVVLDDVWEKDDWKSLNEAFPEKSKGSRVVVTTRHKNLIDSNESEPPHTLTKLNPADSWNLLKKNVFGEEGCNNKSFEEHGREIAEKCNGLPLAIRVIAGILCNNRSIADWERMAKNPFLEINREGQSYHKGQRLDANVVSSRRLCFYSPIVITNIFDPESSNNPSSSFLSCYNKKRGTCPSGERVYTLLLSSVQKGEIQFEGKTESPPDNKSNDLLTKDKIPRPRTQAKRDLHLLIAIPNTFPLLRVLDIESLKLESVPDELYDLNLLRYLAITVDIDLLPKQFRRLRDLETLIFRTMKHTLRIDGGIWNMEKLRHVHTNTCTHLPSLPKNYSSASTEIRTLCTISPESCKEEIMSKTPKLQTLSISGNLEELLEEKQQGISLFKNLQMLDCLENLKLHGLSNKVLTMMPHEKFPLKLRKLTLSNTLFEWNDMSRLGSLDKLETLKLEENCCKGEQWDLNSDVVFKQLQYLRIGRTNLVTWKVERNSFPALERLVLRNCTALETIPDAFGEVYSLKVMELFRVSNRAVDSATELRDRLQREIEKVKSSTVSDPKLHGDQLQSHENEKVKSRRVFNLIITNSLSSQTAAAGADIVGFDDEVKIVKDRLMGESTNLIIISIVGLLGLGKTTLATMLFNDYELQYEFFTRIQVDIPDTFNVKMVFIDILSKLTDKAEKYDTMPEEKLGCKIKEFLEVEKYFIVIDNIRTTQDWGSLKPAFPDNNRGSRVLVTTRDFEVGLCIDSDCNPHRLKILNDEESLQLLEKNVLQGTQEVSDKERCSNLFKAHCRNISTKCKGIPSVVKLIADVLKKNETSEDVWEQIAEDPCAIFGHLDENYNPLAQFIFDEMDLELKNCFLYLADFPEGHEISAWKLIWLWIAEGLFLVENYRNSDWECTGEKYLNKLVDMNLLKVMKRRVDGQIKTCCIGPKLHQLCKIEAAKKNRVHKMDGSESSDDNPAEVNKIDRRCICIKSSVLNFIESEKKSASSKHVDSFLCFCSEEIPNDELFATIPKSFPALRVLDIESLKLKSLPEQLYHLYHLRYLAVSTDLRCLPQGFNKFKNMQTLVFNTSQDGSLKVEADIWSLTKLRHVRTNTYMQLPPPSSNTDSTGIQTLSFISPSSCTAQILGKTPNLQKLGIRGNIVEHMHMESNEEIYTLFENLQMLSRLDNLKLLNNGRRPGELQSVRQHVMFPRSLRKLTLSSMWLEWKEMRILGELDELEVLKLKEYAFKGEYWEFKLLNDEDTVFKQLRYLMIGKTDLVVWHTSASCFPKLEKLVLKDCTHLSEIPLDFAEVPSLMQMELYGTNGGAANSAQKIQMQQHNLGNNQFKLLIDPPHN